LNITKRDSLLLLIQCLSVSLLWVDGFLVLFVVAFPSEFQLPRLLPDLTVYMSNTVSVL